MKLISFTLLTLLVGCSPPTPVSDAQVKLVAEQCAAMHKELQVLNTQSTSTATCR